MEVYAADRGEPGIGLDALGIFFTYDATYAGDVDNDPAVWNTVCNTGGSAPCYEKGRILAGNVQIHRDDPNVIDRTSFGLRATT